MRALLNVVLLALSLLASFHALAQSKTATTA